MKNTVSILAFGIAREIMGTPALQFSVSTPLTIGVLRQKLQEAYPELTKLRTLAFAVNSAYAQEDQEIHPGDEIALIPPVSGG